MKRGCLVIVLIAALGDTASADAPAVKELTGKAIPKVKTLETVERAISWTDSSGPMVAIFSSKESSSEDGRSSYVQLDFASTAGGKPRVLRTVKDKVEDCEEDVTAEFIAGATSVTDLDADGKSELTFAYRISCKGDVSPDTIKLLVLEDEDKYILRGDDTFEPEPGKRQGGTFTPDPAAAQWPAPLLAHAKDAWKSIVKK